MFGNKKSTQKEVVEKVNIGFTSNGKIAYFVEELIENKIISRDGVIGPIFRKHAVAVK